MRKLQIAVYSTFEVQKCEVVNNIAENVYVYNLYRPPYSKNNAFTSKALFDEFEQFIQVCDFQHSILIGDINLKLEEENGKETIYFNSLFSHLVLESYKIRIV